MVDFGGGGRGRVLVRADTTGGQRRWIQWGSMTGPHWSEIQVVGGRGGGRFILLSVNNQTADKSSAVKCGRGHCGEQFMKGIVGASLPHYCGSLLPPTQSAAGREAALNP